MSAPEIARLGPDDVPLLRELRLEALNAHPEFFSADPDYESTLTPEQWRERLRTSQWLVCKVDGEIAGLCAFSRVRHTKKLAHTGSLGSMYVREAFRGKGVADALVTAVLDIAVASVEQISLTVNATNARAIAFYEKFGFKQYGRVPRALHVGGRYYDDVEMMRAISLSD